jgi:glycosyltransferase involved in cell wall biosynthesis
MDRALVIVPALNEADSLPRVIPAVRAACGADLLVVDDGSTDATARVALELGARVVSHPFNLGYGAALQTGYRFALRRGYAVAVQLDADGQHEPSDAPRLLEALAASGADLVIGSRFLGEGSYRPPAVRRIGMRLFRAAVRFHTGQRLTDSTSGFRALGRRAMEFLSGERHPVDFPDADVLIMLHRAGLRVVEIPARMHAARAKPSMHGGLWRPLYYVFKMALSIFVTLLRGRERVIGPPQE